VSFEECVACFALVPQYNTDTAPRHSTTRVVHRHCPSCTQLLLVLVLVLVFVLGLVACSFPAYPATVPRPLHLRLIIERLHCGYYRHVPALAYDISLVAVNCKLFNQPGRHVCSGVCVFCVWMCQLTARVSPVTALCFSLPILLFLTCSHRFHLARFHLHVDIVWVSMFGCFLVAPLSTHAQCHCHGG